MFTSSSHANNGTGGGGSRDHTHTESIGIYIYVLVWAPTTCDCFSRPGFGTQYSSATRLPLRPFNTSLSLSHTHTQCQRSCIDYVAAAVAKLLDEVHSPPLTWLGTTLYIYISLAAECRTEDSVCLYQRWVGCCIRKEKSALIGPWFHYGDHKGVGVGVSAAQKWGLRIHAYIILYSTLHINIYKPSSTHSPTLFPSIYLYTRRCH